MVTVSKLYAHVQTHQLGYSKYVSFLGVDQFYLNKAVEIMIIIITEGFVLVTVGMWEICTESAQFLCKPQSALQNKMYN